jgi:hypothetical protein
MKLLKEYITKLLRESSNEYEEVDKETFEDTLIDLSTLSLEDNQVRYPKIENKTESYLFGGNDYDLYVLDRDSLPSSGSFEIIIKDNDDEIIGFIRGNKKDEIISFKLIHIQENSRGKGIGTDIYEKLLKDNYIIKSDSEITDDTYNMYSKLPYYGYQRLKFNDGTVGLKK